MARLKEKIAYHRDYIFLNDDIKLFKTGSIFFPYAIRDIGYISRWSKSAKLINSFWENKKETL